MAAADVVLDVLSWAEGVAPRECSYPECDERLERFLERMAVGDRQALGELYDATTQVVYGLALRITGGKRAAVRVTESVYEDLWEQSAAVAGGGDPLVWLVERTRAEAMNQRRRIWSRLAAWLRPTPSASQANAGRSAGLVTGSWEPKRQQALGALEGLAGADREVLELAYFSGMKSAEIARKLGLSEAEVRGRIREGVRNFREGLALRQLGIRA